MTAFAQAGYDDTGRYRRNWTIAEQIRAEREHPEVVAMARAWETMAARLRSAQLWPHSCVSFTNRAPWRLLTADADPAPGDP